MDKIREIMDASFIPEIEKLTKKLNRTIGLSLRKRKKYLPKIQEITERIQNCNNK